MSSTGAPVRALTATVSRAEARRLGALVVHLTGQRLRSMHRLGLLGWLWPLARQLVQLVVLVFLFSRVVRLHIPDYPLFVFTGLLIWNWMQAGLLAASTAFIADRHLVFSPRLPNGVLPVVAMTVPLIDTVMALPLLVLAAAIAGQLHPTILLLPIVLVLEFVLIAGLSLIVATANVFVRDVQNLVGVGLLLFFYLTPVFYRPASVPSSLHWITVVNPISDAVSAARSLVISGTLPRLIDVAVLAGAALIAAVLGTLILRRLGGELIDEL